MSGRTERAAAWVYEGVWGMLVDWFRVPAEPPTLPARAGETLLQFRPAPGFLRYLKFLFWVGLLVIDIAILAVTIAILVAVPLLGCVLLLPALAIAVVPDILAYVALHLRYDTTWYVMTDRSLRIRRGIWIISEVTVTFENVQNLSVRQGPLQRHFGIASLVVQTAGGGGGAAEGKAATGHEALIEGIDNAPELRDRILRRLRESQAAGLGDEQDAERQAAPAPAWTAEQVQALREVRDEVRALAAAS